MTACKCNHTKPKQALLFAVYWLNAVYWWYLFTFTKFFHYYTLSPVPGCAGITIPHQTISQAATRRRWRGCELQILDTADNEWIISIRPGPWGYGGHTVPSVTTIRGQMTGDKSALRLPRYAVTLLIPSGPVVLVSALMTRLSSHSMRTSALGSCNGIPRSQDLGPSGDQAGCLFPGHIRAQATSQWLWLWEVRRKC